MYKYSSLLGDLADKSEDLSDSVERPDFGDFKALKKKKLIQIYFIKFC